MYRIFHEITCICEFTTELTNIPRNCSKGNNLSKTENQMESKMPQ